MTTDVCVRLYGGAKKMEAGLLQRLRLAATLLTAEFQRGWSDSLDLRALLLRKKTLYELGYGEGLAPDGLSDAYLAMAAARNAKTRRAHSAVNTEVGIPAGALTQALADMVQEEVATALMLERRLLHCTEA
jgi:hypothetical protein